MNTSRVKWSVLGHEAQHAVLRFGAIVFAVASSLSVYWYFSALIDNKLWQVVIALMTGGFIIMGYFVMRGWSHRMKDKRPAGSYMLVVVLYLYVEVICNLAHAMEHYPAIQFVGLAAVVFSYMKLSVLAIMPVFGIVLAKVDVDMLREKGAVPQVPVALPTSSGGAGQRATLGTSRGSVPPPPAPPSWGPQGQQMKQPAASTWGAANGASGQPSAVAWGSANRGNGQPTMDMSQLQQMVTNGQRVG